MTIMCESNGTTVVCEINGETIAFGLTDILALFHWLRAQDPDYAEEWLAKIDPRLARKIRKALMN